MNVGHPVVSVMTPCYNASGTLGLALASLVAQTYADWECIVVDDGSEDSPKKVVDAFNDRRIRYINLNKNHGRPFARQVAMNAARGKYLAMLDADDWYYPDKLERQVKILEEHPAIAAVSGGMCVHGADYIPFGAQRAGSGTGEVQLSYFEKPTRPPIAYGPAMIRMKEAKQVDFDLRLSRAQDSDFLVRLLLGRQYATILSPIYGYLELEAMTLSKINDGIRCGRLMYQKYLRENPIIASRRIVSGLLKQIIYNAAFRVGLLEALVRRRSRPLLDSEVTEFEVALRAVRDVMNTVDLPGGNSAAAAVCVHSK